MASPTADVSVRIAWADDAAAVAAVQARAWRTTYAGVLPDEALALDPEATSQAWAAALRSPGDARNRVLVALERNRVVGFAVISPADRPRLRPGRRRRAPGAGGRPGRARQGPRLPAPPGRRGHDAGRPVHPGGDLDAGRRGRPPRAFLTDAGWGADTAHRELDLDGTGSTVVKQVRLHTAL